jgi:hypothetical protein
MKLIGRIGSFAFCCHCLICFAAAPPRYRVKDLGLLPSGVMSAARAVNEQGDAAGYCVTTHGARAFLYSGETMINLNDSFRRLPFGSPIASGALDINNRGEVIGYAINGEGLASTPFLYSNGVVSYYSSSGGGAYLGGVYFPVFVRINDYGHILGLTGNGTSGIFNGQTVAEYLPLVPGASTFSSGLNNSDQAAGTTVNAAGQDEAVILMTNGIIDLRHGGASAINNLGHVVGADLLTGDSFLYRDGVFTAIGSGVPVSLNNFDEVVGFYGIDSGGDKPFVYIGGKNYFLNDTIPSGSGYVVHQANDINDDGVIAGSATLRDGSEHAVLLIPADRRPHRHFNKPGPRH